MKYALGGPVMLAIMAVGIPLNALSISIWSSREMMTAPTSIYMVALGVFDIVHLLVQIPMTAYHITYSVYGECLIVFFPRPGRKKPTVTSTTPIAN